MNLDDVYLLRNGSLRLCRRTIKAFDDDFVVVSRDTFNMEYIDDDDEICHKRRRCDEMNEWVRIVRLCCDDDDVIMSSTTSSYHHSKMTSFVHYYHLCLMAQSVPASSSLAKHSNRIHQTIDVV